MISPFRPYYLQHSTAQHSTAQHKHLAPAVQFGKMVFSNAWSNVPLPQQSDDFLIVQSSDGSPGYFVLTQSDKAGIKPFQVQFIGIGKDAVQKYRNNDFSGLQGSEPFFFTEKELKAAYVPILETLQRAKN